MAFKRVCVCVCGSYKPVNSALPKQIAEKHSTYFMYLERNLQCFDAVRWVRKGIRPVKTEWWGAGGVIFVWSEVQTCI